MAAFLQRHLPGLYALKKRFKGRHLLTLTPQQVFTAIYHQRGWLHAESVSGSGSTLEATQTIRRELTVLVAELQVLTLLDLPCGDFHWMQHVDLGPAYYIGADIVPELVETNQSCYTTPMRRFILSDLLTDPLPSAELVFCRDCLPHFSDRDIFQVLENVMRSEADYFLTTTYIHSDVNWNIVTGQWRPLNLQLSPFQLPEPMRLIDEHTASGSGQRYGKSLGLWSVASLRQALAKRE